MDLHHSSTGLLIAALTLGSVGIFLIWFASLQVALTVTLVLLIVAIGLFSFTIWRRGNFPWYFMCSWTVPFVSAIVLVVNFSKPLAKIRFFGMLFIAAGMVNLLMWGLFHHIADE